MGKAFVGDGSVEGNAPEYETAFVADYGTKGALQVKWVALFPKDLTPEASGRDVTVR